MVFIPLFYKKNIINAVMAESRLILLIYFSFIRFVCQENTKKKEKKRKTTTTTTTAGKYFYSLSICIC